MVTHGQNGLFVTPGSASDLAGPIRTLLSDQQLRTALAGRARNDIARYDWEIRARTILTEIEANAPVAYSTRPVATLTDGTPNLD